MIKQRKRIVLLICAAIMNVSVIFPAGGDVTDIVEIDTLPADSGYSKIWQPFIAMWTDNHYVVSYGLQLRDKGDMGDLVCSISKDRGTTWSPPIMIFDHRIPNGSVRYAFNNSVLFRPPGHDILWCFAMRTPMHFRDSEDARLCAAYSGDGGHSWTQVELAMDYHGPVITCAGIVPVKNDRGTRYLLGVHRNTIRHEPMGDRQQFVLESRSLLRWKLAGRVPVNSDQPAWIHEGNIAEGDAQGELKMVTRTGAHKRGEPRPGVAYSSVSRDGGRTWSAALPEPELPNFQSKAFYGKDSRGRHVYVYSDKPEREGLYYKVKPEGGAWSASKLFFGGETRNSYPTLIEDEPGEWLCVWDSSNDIKVRRSVIRFGRWRVETE
jgi:hypothetical protein